MGTHYEDRKAKGICVRCTLPAANGTVYCEVHLAAARDYQKSYRRNKKSSGLCIWPGCKTPTKGKSYCRAHVEELRKLQPERYRCGLTDEVFEEMVQKQGGVCAICKKKPEGTFHVDHDHKTGKVRSLLCRDCNFGLGFFKDDPDILAEAILYLRRNSLNTQ